MMSAKALFPVAEMAFGVSRCSMLCGPQIQIQALHAFILAIVFLSRIVFLCGMCLCTTIQDSIPSDL